MADIGKPVRETERPAPVRTPLPDREPVPPSTPLPAPDREPVKAPAVAPADGPLLGQVDVRDLDHR